MLAMWLLMMAELLLLSTQNMCTALHTCCYDCECMQAERVFFCWQNRQRRKRSLRNALQPRVRRQRARRRTMAARC